MIEWIVVVLMFMGSVFCLIAAVGIVRLPDTLIRMHAATKAGTLGAGMILAAVAVSFGDVGTIFRALLALVFLYMTAPVAAHLIGRAAYRSGIRLYHRTWVDHLKQDMPGKPDLMKADPTTKEFQSN
jgi:multicomponent Na+:H+ antiporter subunit G